MPIHQFIQQAHQVCEQRNVRLTPAREQVLSLLLEEQSAIGAYNLLAKLQQHDPAAKPATIYRALDFLGKQGFVHKIESINAYTLCHHLSECYHPVQLLICDQCGKVDEIQSNSLHNAINELAEKQQFRVSHQIIEAHGLCAECQH